MDNGSPRATGGYLPNGPSAPQCIDMPQKQILRLQRFLQRDDVELALVFAFAVEPGGEHRQRGGIRVFPLLDRAIDQLRAL